MLSSQLSSLALASVLSFSDAAAAFHSIPITRNTLSVPNMRNITGKDRARVKSFGTTTNLLGVVPVINEDVSYIVPITIGNQTFRLIADTGSSNTWIGAGTPYSPGPASVKDGRFVSVTYGSGSFSGSQYTDTIGLGSISAKNQSISVATYSKGFDGTDGILGLGPEKLTQGTITGSSSLIPTVMQTLEEQQTIEQNVLGVYFQPLTGSNMTEANGELSFGGPDPSRYTGQITYANITSNPLYSSYWGIDIDKVSFDGRTSTVLIQGVSAIVDTGTTLTYLPAPALDAFCTATNGTIDRETTLPVFSQRPSSNLTFTVSNTRFTLSPDQYLVPAEQYEIFGLDSTKFYAWLGNGGGLGAVNFIIGQKVLEHIYSVYDTTNNRLGLAYALPKGAAPQQPQHQSQSGPGSGSTGSSASASSASRARLSHQACSLVITFVLCFVSLI